MGFSENSEYVLYSSCSQESKNEKRGCDWSNYYVFCQKQDVFKNFLHAREKL